MSEIVDLSKNLILLIDLETEDLNDSLKELPTSTRIQIESGVHFKNLKTLRDRAIQGNNRILESVNYLPNIKSFESLEAELKRIRQIYSGLPKNEDIRATSSKALQSIPRFICKKGAALRIPKASGKCPSGFSRIKVR
jgi:hypothetical protein